MSIEIYFDGYCPESLLKGKHVEMYLNKDDFWESKETGLQITVFPPFAAILRWRGKGKFRESSDKAWDVLSGLVMTEAKWDPAQEIFPEESEILGHTITLEWYLDTVYKTKEEYDADKFDPNDPRLLEQEKLLSSLGQRAFEDFFIVYDKLLAAGINSETFNGELYNNFYEKLYDTKLIFPFNWKFWHSGWKNLNNEAFDYSICNMLQLSMYITAVIRCDRFNDGTIKMYFKNGTMGKIFGRLRGVNQ